MLMYADNLVLVAESKSDFRVMIECLDFVCRRKGMKVNAGKNKGMVFSEIETVCNVIVGDCLEQVV